jgi:hypothetical protein
MESDTIIVYELYVESGRSGEQSVVIHSDEMDTLGYFFRQSGLNDYIVSLGVMLANLRHALTHKRTSSRIIVNAVSDCLAPLTTNNANHNPRSLSPCLGELVLENGSVGNILWVDVFSNYFRY